MGEPDDIISRGFLPYNKEAPDLRSRYAVKPFAEKHKNFRPYFPNRPAKVLDVGAGIGVDARGFAGLGHQVVAVEPADAMRGVAMEAHDHSGITWLDDHLPTLDKVSARGELFDFVLVSASFMHLSPDHQKSGMKTLGDLTARGGHVCMTLRHGPVPDGRTMYDISDEAALKLAELAGLTCVLKEHGLGQKNVPGVTWSSFVLEKR